MKLEYTPTIITLSHLRWDFVYQRPQHLLSRLASRHRVIFIEEPTSGEIPALEWHFDRPEPNVLVCRPQTPCEAPGFCDEQAPYIRALLRELIAAENLQDYVLWFYTPMALPLARQDLQPRAVVYDCMDELSAFLHAPPQLLRARGASCCAWPTSSSPAAPACTAPRRTATRTSTASPAASTRPTSRAAAQRHAGAGRPGATCRTRAWASSA